VIAALALLKLLNSSGGGLVFSHEMLYGSTLLVYNVPESALGDARSSRAVDLFLDSCGQGLGGVGELSTKIGNFASQKIVGVLKFPIVIL
jgi:hypothetical protein